MKDHKGYYHSSHKLVTSNDEQTYLKDGTFSVNSLLAEVDNSMSSKYVLETKVNDARVPEAREYRPKMFVKIPVNNKGIDYICGDLHGCMDELHASLTEVGFDYFKDRLFCTGDLIDRGASSHRALRLMREPWFYTVRGNHEDMILTAWESRKDTDVYLHIHNGGSWFWKQSVSYQEQYIDAIRKLPMGIQVGSIGIVHADYLFNKWDLNMLQRLWETEIDHTDMRNILLWSRETVLSDPDNMIDVKGIDYIYCGHSIVDYPTEIGNIRFIDTGAFTEKGYLTLFKLHGLHVPVATGTVS